MAAEQVRKFRRVIGSRCPPVACASLLSRAGSGRGSRNSAGSSMSWSFDRGFGHDLLAVKRRDVEHELMKGRAGVLDDLGSPGGGELALVALLRRAEERG